MDEVDRLRQLIDNGFPDDSQRAARLMSMMAVHQEGPIPSPSVLKGYPQVDPGLPERLVFAWERPENHRRDLENRAFENNQGRLDRGQRYNLCWQ